MSNPGQDSFTAIGAGREAQPHLHELPERGEAGETIVHGNLLDGAVRETQEDMACNVHLAVGIVHLPVVNREFPGYAHIKRFIYQRK